MCSFIILLLLLGPLLALAILALAGAIAGIVFATLNKGAEASNQVRTTSHLDLFAKPSPSCVMPAKILLCCK